MQEKNGEHPLGDSGQLILFVLFLLIWLLDSFILQISTFLSDYVSGYIRLIIFLLIFIFYNHIAGYEEKLLEDRFNEAYRNYKEKTGKWVPLIGRES